MKRKSIQVFLMALLLANWIAVANIRVVSSEPEPVISVNPAQSTAMVDQSFTVDINIADVTLENTYDSGVTGWEVDISFNSTMPPILKVLAVGQGPWLRTAGSTMWIAPKIDNAKGTVIIAEAFVPAKRPGALGSGALANITFQALSVGRISLHFYKTVLRAFDGDQIRVVDHTTADGSFTNLHDVSVVSVDASPKDVQPGVSVSVDVVAANEGDFSETFSVTAYRSIGSMRLTPDFGTQSVTNLFPYSSVPLVFSWDTTGVYAGNYTINAEASMVSGEVDVVDNKLVNGMVTVSIAGAPRSSLIYSPHLPSAGEMVVFNSTSSDTDGGTITSWQWDFNGDGTVDATSENASYTYVTAGTYTAILYVTDDSGKVAFSYEMIRVTSYPVASFTYSPSEVLVRQPVTFSSTSYDSDGQIVSWEWDLNGDGTLDSSDEKPTYTYNDVGTYAVNLTVADNDGLVDSVSIDVPVSTKHDVAVVWVKIWGEYKGPPQEPDVSTYAGSERLNVTVFVRNIGTEIENFNVTAHYDGVSIGQQLVLDLAPADQAPLNERRIGILWDTNNVLGGNYTVTGTVVSTTDENATNNIAATGLEVRLSDLAITSVTVSSDEVLASRLMNVTFVVRNKGTSVENCIVSAVFTNSTSRVTIGSLTVLSVAPGSDKTSTLTRLNATKAGVLPGLYALSVEALKGPNEYLTADNVFTYGDITWGTSLISVSAHPSPATVGYAVTVNGTITPLRSGALVTVRYRLSGETSWNTLQTATTDADGKYTVEWTPEETGTYELKASWNGDSFALSGDSEILTVEVQAAPTNILLYAAIGAVVVVALIVGVYFLKFRKPKK